MDTKTSTPRLTREEISFGLDETIASLLERLADDGQAIFAPRAEMVKTNSERYDLVYRIQLYILAKLDTLITDAAMKARRIWYLDAYTSRFVTPKAGKETGWLTHIQGQIQGQLKLAADAGVVATSFPGHDGQKNIYLAKTYAEALERALVNGEALLDALENPRPENRQKTRPQPTWGGHGPKYSGNAARGGHGRRR